ncbi:MAG: DUF1700 domain-containing protein [Oscillospiraceae bacterium]|nr:DUF1700 domain-containing protein [Oscillospiraceae bacterium]
MIAENKAEFFEELERELQRLGVEDTSELFADLEEHFAEGERRGISESEVCRELGSIKEIARSCLDLKSSAINSMVAHEATRKKAVSLTKPGRDVPADPSLAKPPKELQEDAVRSVTPEHIAEEVIPGSPNSVAPENASQTENPQNPTPENSQDNSQGSTQNDSQNSTQEAGVFEKIGKKVDEACDKAGQALNGAFDKAGGKVGEALKKTPLFGPSDSYRGNINDNRKGEIPKQEKKIKTKDASKFVDVSQLTPNVKPGRLVFEIILDVLLWIWLVPTVIVAALAMFVAAAGIVFGGVVMLLGLWNNEFARYFLPTRILFALGFFALASFVACLASVLVKPAFALPKYVVRRHVRAVYDV